MHDIEANGAVDGLGAFIFEGGSLGLLIDGEARAAIERVDLLCEAESAQGLGAFDAVVHLVQVESARTGTLTVDERGKILGQRIHIY